MSLTGRIRYRMMKDLGAPLLMGLPRMRRRKRPVGSRSYYGPPLKCTQRLKQIMARHYYLSRYVPGARPVAWVTSGAPVELLRVFNFYTIYPENHGALCGAKKMGPELCEVAEDHGYSQDLCSYARIDLGYHLSGKTPVGKMPKPDLLFCSNNICQTIVYWFKALSYELDIPLILFDTPYNFTEMTLPDTEYMTDQLKEMIPLMERVSGKHFDPHQFEKILRISQESSLTWGKVLATLKKKPAPMTIFDAFGHLAPIVSLRGLPVTLDYYHILLRELEERVEKGVGAIKNEQKRLMWDNIAIWYKVRDFSNLFASRGMNFVTATYTNAWAETTALMDAAEPFKSMARAYSLVILNNNLNHRLHLMERLIKEFQVDGLVIHSARSCKPYSVGQYDLKRLLMNRIRVPSVVIEADITDYRVYSEEQTMTRLEAFFETLQA